jgi:6-phosphofructokinase 2
METAMNDKSNQVSVLALNPAVDIGYIIPQLLEYQKVLAEQTLYHPGGNGINITRALTELGVPAHCCSVIAGESGDLLLKLLADTFGDRHTWFRVDGETRINTTIMQQNPPGQYEITSFGPEIPGDVVKAVCDCLLEHTGNGIGVLSGLIPPSVDETTYAEVTQSINDQGGRAVVDARPNVLTHVIEAKPWMVRINKHRLERLMNQVLDNVEDVAEAARSIQQQGIEYVCITLGDNGAVLVDPDNSYHGDAPRIHKQSTVGCGDSMVTGLIASSIKGEIPQEMLRFGIMCASATASQPGTVLFKGSDLESWDIDIEITALDR